MKVAVCFTPDRHTCLAAVERMAQAQTLYDSQTYQIFGVHHGAIASIAASERLSAVPLLRQGAQGNLLLISGVPIDLHGALEQTLQAILAEDYGTAARTLSALDGAFAAVFWDNRHQRLVIVMDFLGMQPLYLVHEGTLLLLATELKGLGASGQVALELDPAGWGAFLSFGHFLGSHTSLKAARRVEPGSVLVYDPANGALETTRYWHWPAPKAGVTQSTWDTGALVDALRRNVHAYLVHTTRGTVLLSGGFDSRLILALLHESQVHPKALIVKHQDDHLGADGRFAVRIAKRLHVEYELALPQKSHFSSAAYLDYLLMNEVATPSMNLFIAQVAAYIRPDMQAVWEGVFPGYTLMPPGQPPGGFAAYLRHACRGREARVWQAAARVFARPLVEQMYEAFVQSLDAEKARYPDDGFGVSEFIIRNRTRYRTAPNPLQVYANHVLPLTPGLTKAFWELVAVIPFEAKADFKLYLDLYQRHFPMARAVPYNSGGTLVKGVGFDPSFYAYRYVPGVLHQLSLRYNLRRLGLRKQSPEWWHPSTFVSRAVAQVNADHPDLNPPVVQRLKQGAPDQLPGPARVLLFYWQTWRWMMEGRLSTTRHDMLLPLGNSSQSV